MTSTALAQTLQLPDSQGAVPAVLAGAGVPVVKATVQFFEIEIDNPNTRRSYASDIRQFCLWCDRRGIALAELNPFVINQYKKDLLDAKLILPGIKEGPLSIPSVKRKLAALRRFFDYLVAEHGVLPSNPAAGVRGPKYVVKEGKTPVFLDDELDRLYATIDIAKIGGLRDRALISLLYYSWARIGAVLGDEYRDDDYKGVKVKHYFAMGKTWHVRLLEKGNKEHVVPLHHKVVEHLDAYIDAAGIADQSDSHLFRAMSPQRQLTERPLRPKKAWEMIKRRARQAGLRPGFGNHAFRGSGITDYLVNGGDLEYAQRQAYHATIRTTKIYDRRHLQLSIDEVEKMPSREVRVS